VLDKPIEGGWQRHQRGLLWVPYVGNTPGQCCKRDLVPQRKAALFQPVSFSAKGSSLLCRSGVMNCGSIVPTFKYFVVVLRDIPERLAMLSHRELLPQRHTSDYFRNSHVYHSIAPRLRIALRGKDHMAQISVEIICLSGSLLRRNLHIQANRNRKWTCRGLMPLL